jgi:hypothetical protein
MSTTEFPHQQVSVTQPAIGPGSAGIRMTPSEFDAIDNYDE